ncbi:MAG: STAS domain-containing protein [Fibrobacteria bacterium]|nr:STAS domain-containing protein [Fibrobacteria bacterium]
MVMLINFDDFSMESQDRLHYHLITIVGSFNIKCLVEARNEITNLLDLSAKNFIFNLEKCTEMDSSTIGMLSNLYKKLLERDGSMGILAPSAQMERLLHETGLDKIIPIYSCLEEVESFYD